MRKKAGSRILTYVLTLCMIIGSITWPEITAKAETITKDLKPDTGWKTVTAATDEWSDYGKTEIRFSPSSDLASMKAIADAGRSRSHMRLTHLPLQVDRMRELCHLHHMDLHGRIMTSG